VIAAHDAPVVGVAITPDGARVISASADKSVKVWTLANLKPGVKDEPTTKMTLPAAAQSLALSPNGTRVVVASAEQPITLRAFDLVTGKELLSIGGHTAAVAGLAFLPDNRMVVSGGADKSLRLSDVGVLGAWEGHAGGVASASFNNTGVAAIS